MGSPKIRDFTDLVAWQKSHALVLTLYRVSGGFPKSEVFGLTSQMRRAAISITSNIAEGFGRRSSKDKQQFFFIALGSLYELQSQLLACRDLGFLSMTPFKELADLLFEAKRLLLGLVHSTDKAAFY